MFSHCRLNNPTEICSCLHSKVPSDWLSSYIKAVQLVLKIFKNGWISIEKTFCRFYVYHMRVKVPDALCFEN